jgi:hypothetical protein
VGKKKIHGPFFPSRVKTKTKNEKKALPPLPLSRVKKTQKTCN